MGLVLTLKTNETLQIGENIFIRVRKVQANRTKVLIDAPKDFKIMRQDSFELEEQGLIGSIGNRKGKD